MRTYLDAHRLGEALKAKLTPNFGDQVIVSRKMGLTQGALSNILRGRFKFLSKRVAQVCKHARIDPMSYERPKNWETRDLNSTLRRLRARGPHALSAAREVLRALDRSLS